MKLTINIGMILLTLMLGATAAVGQQGSAITFVDNEGVHIRWTIHPEAEGYFVYRSGGNSGWQKVSGTPVPLMTDNREIRDAVGNKADILLGMVGLNNKNSDLSVRDITSASRNEEQFKLLQAFSLINPEFALVFGLTYLDGEPSGPIRYKITAIVNSDEEDWAETGPVNAGSLDPLPDVDGLEGDGMDRSAMLSWDKDQRALNRGEIVTYHVYRAENELGPFYRVNYYGILPGRISFEGSQGLNANSNQQQHLDEGLENGRTYFYYVKAVNAFGYEGPASLTIEVVAGDFSPPAPPNNIEAVQSGNAARITWSHDDDQLKGFEITRAESPDGEYEVIYPASNGKYSTFKQYLDFNLSPGLIYYYKLRSVNAKDISGPWSTPVEYINWDKVPPSAPVGVKAETDDEGRITISWDASEEEDVVGYHVDRATDNNYDWQFRMNMKMLTETQYIDERPVESQTTYGYVVYAIDRSLNQSPASEMVYARLPDIVPPQPPIITSLTESGNTVSLSWTTSIEDDFEKYQVYRADSEVQPFQKLSESVEAAYEDELEADEGKFLYHVTAIDKDGNESEPSNVISLTRELDPLPDAPVSGTIAVQDGNVIITWKAPSDDRVTGYLVSRYVGSSSVRVDAADLDGDDVLEFKDYYTVAGKSYTYEIRSRDDQWQLSRPFTLIIEME